MADFDLIPNDYRLLRWREAWLKRFGFASLGLVLLSAAAYATLIYVKGVVRSEVEQLQVRRTITTQQTSELLKLRKQKQEYEYQWRLLTGLRSGATAERMFRTIDKALSGDAVWFLNWRFRRAGVSIGSEQQGVNNGYFVVVSQDERQTGSEAWRIETHMEIKGQALDHSALSQFVRALFKQPEIHDVRVIRTALRRVFATSVVDFDLAVVVNSSVGRG
ncbi:MAG: hypothetical protein GY807_08315 [Gammaproteobacteria bacterium]|nr:hypothetical protein [Gammaproteobacteria bacterium]